MPQETALCVDGPYDGKRFPLYPRLHYPIRRDISIYVAAKPEFDQPAYVDNFRTGTYVAVRGSDGEYYYVHEKGPNDVGPDSIAKLDD